MNKKLMSIGITLVFLIVGFSGCVSEESKFVGKWENNLGFVIYTFYGDGKYNGTVTEGTFKIERCSKSLRWEYYSRIENGKLICISDDGYTVSYNYNISDDGKTLMLEGIGTSDYTLKKNVQ